VNRTILRFAIVGCLGAALCACSRAQDDPACAGPRLGTPEARNEALEAGYEINRERDCIDKDSFARVQAQEAERQRAVASASSTKAAAAESSAPAQDSLQTLQQARRGFQTKVSVPTQVALPLPMPPAALFVRSDYPVATGQTLAAFVTPDPGDARKHPAIIWLTGGDTNSLDDFWTPGTDANDQSVHAFRDAGVVMMFPTLRGGNGNPGSKEYFLGEVEDVLAAAEHLARLGWVDPQQVYLGGHSTGGTLALLTAESSGRFTATFAFGAVARVDRYHASIVPVRFDQLPDDERRLRSPVDWLQGLSSPTYVIEGTERPGNLSELEELCAASTAPALHCISVEGHNHFGVLGVVSPVIAARIALAAEGIPFALRAGDFQLREGKPIE
jgi:acetyl esterase/lipase